MNPKLSFIIPAHNEEKIIAKTLQNLATLDYDNYEVLVGLDGCTDRTEEIVREFVKKNNKIRYFSLNLRQGKPPVVDNLIKKAKGDIIVINDADWIFTIKDRKSLEEFLSIFKDKEIGGIAEPLPLEWHREGMKKGNFTYRMVAYSSYLWYEFQVSKFSKKTGNYRTITSPALFMTNIFRKSLYKKNESLADDFERTHDIMKSGSKIAIPNNASVRMIPVYHYIGLKDFFKQKIRTAKARDQISGESNIDTQNYYTPVVMYIFRKSWHHGFSIGLMMSFWIVLTSIATIISKFKKFNTKEGWKLRVKR